MNSVAFSPCPSMVAVSLGLHAYIAYRCLQFMELLNLKPKSKQFINIYYKKFPLEIISVRDENITLGSSG
jgi:hypothetical protein